MLNRHHKHAVRLLCATAALAVIFGILISRAEHVPAWHGIYCSTGLATTDGCDLQLHGWQAYTLGELSMILMIPLWTAVFAFFTTGLTADHIDRKHDEMTTTVRGSQ